MNKRKELETSIRNMDIAALNDEQLAAIKIIIDKKQSVKKKEEPSGKNAATETDIALQTIMMALQPFAVAITDSKGCVLIKNETMNALLGDAFPEQMCIFNNELLLAAAGKKEFAKLKSGGTIHIDELWYEKRTAANEIIPICIHALIFPLADINKSITNFVIIHVNITKHKLAEKAWKDVEEKFNLIFENNERVVFYESGMDGKVIDVSESIKHISKYTREEMIGSPAGDLYFDQHDRDMLMKELFAKKQLFNYNVKLKDKDGKAVYTTLHSKIIYDQKGNPQKIMGVIFDVTSMHETAVELKQIEESYREIIENTNDAIFTLDLEANVISVNPVAEKMFGYQPGELYGQNLRTYLSPESSVISGINKDAKLKGEKTNTVYEVDFRSKNGTYTALEVNTQLRYKDGKPFEIFGVAKDITERRKAIEELKKSEERYRDIFDNINDIIYTIDMHGKIISLNSAAEKILGINFYNLSVKDIYRLLSPETGKQAIQQFEEKLNGKRTSTAIEIELKNKYGDYSTFEVSSQMKYKDGKPYEIFGILRDITARKKAIEALKDSEEKYKLIFENAPLGIMTADINGNLIEVNPALLNVLGSPSIEQTKMIKLFKFQPLIDAGFVKVFKQAIKTGKALTVESAYTSKWGVHFEARLYAKPLKGQKGKVEGLQCIVEDITEQKNAEKRLKAALAEKEILIREVHHRVKNNMQVIISLINMHKYESKDLAVISKLRELQQRVRTMAIIHEDLYRSDDLSKINFSKYLNKLADNLYQIYPHDFKIDMDMKIPNVFLDINTAIPCGLILNEILSNSYKHAFPEKWRERQKKKEFKVFVKFRFIDGKFLLEVGDNGIGISEEAIAKNKNSLGLDLVEILVAQMKGTFKRYNKRGARYEIVIDKEMKN